MPDDSRSSVFNSRKSMVDWPRLAELVRTHQRFMLTTHVRPDCDALGSVLGMAGVLEYLGKDVIIANGYAVPPNLRFIDPERRIKCLADEVSAEELESIEVLMVLDTGAWAQLSHIEELIRTTRARKIVLDHHVSGDDLGAEVFKDTAAEATGRMVAEAAERLNVPISPQMATPLFAAVAGDTGWFRFGSTTADTYRLAARLVDAGAVPAEIYAAAHEQETPSRLRLVGRALAQIKTELGGRLIHTCLRGEDFELSRALPSDSEDIINMTMAAAGTEVAVILVEQQSGQFKISFRSRCDVDCSRLAEQFGGGGHKAAAGALVEGPFESAQSKVLDAVRAAMQ